MNVPADRYEQIAKEIASDASPVGIDAKKTHIMILHLLEDIQQRLRRIEEQMGLSEPREKSD